MHLLLGALNPRKSRITAHFHFSQGKKIITKFLAQCLEYSKSRPNLCQLSTWFTIINEIFYKLKGIECYFLKLIIKGGHKLSYPKRLCILNKNRGLAWNDL